MKNTLALERIRNFLPAQVPSGSNAPQYVKAVPQSIRPNLSNPGNQKAQKYSPNVWMTPMQLERMRFDIQSWRACIIEAENAWLPHRVRMQTMYYDTVLNEHLFSCMERRKNLTLLRKFKMCDAKGEKDDDLTKQFDAGWFYNFINYTLDALFYGYTLVRLNDLIDDKFPNISFWPRELVSPDRMNMVSSRYMTQGVPIYDPEVSDWYIYVKTPSETGRTPCGYGLLYKVAKTEIYLRNNIGQNADFNEIYGQPIRKGTTAKQDAERSQFEQAIASMGSNAWIVLDEDDKLELVETAGIGRGFMTFENLEKRLEQKISKTILGHADAMDSTPGKLGATQEDGPTGEALEDVQTHDARFVEPVINDELLPRLRRFGFKIPDDIHFEFVNDDEGEEQREREDTSNLVTAEIAQTMKAAGLIMDAKYFEERTGITTEAAPDPPAAIIGAPGSSQKGTSPFKKKILNHLGVEDGVSNYDPNEPRAPAGAPGGGQWTKQGGGSERQSRINPRLKPFFERALDMTIKNGGFSLRPKTLSDVNNENYIVALGGYEQTYPLDNFTTTDLENYYTKHSNEFHKDNRLIFGGWWNKDNNKIYLDLSKGFDDKDAAMKFGMSTKQLKGWDAKKGEEFDIYASSTVKNMSKLTSKQLSEKLRAMHSNYILNVPLGEEDGKIENRVRIILDTAVRDADYGSMNNMPVTRRNINRIKDWMVRGHSTMSGKINDGETAREFIDRTIGRYEQIKDDEPANTVCVTHNSVMKAVKAWDNPTTWRYIRKPVNYIMNTDQWSAFADQYNTETAANGELYTTPNDFHFIRHGEATKDNTGLSYKGKSQAATAGEYLYNKTFGYVPKIISSDRGRTLQTASIVQGVVNGRIAQLTNYSDGEQRVPSGSHGGGQWTSSGIGFYDPSKDSNKSAKDIWPNADVWVDSSLTKDTSADEVQKKYMAAIGLPKDFDGKVKIGNEGDNILVMALDSLLNTTEFHEGGLVKDEYLEIKEDSKYKGHGAEIFKSHVQELARQGYLDVELLAAGVGKNKNPDSDMNGFYTWARLGFTPVPNIFITKAVDEFNQAHGTNVKTLPELISTKEGQQFWKENGRPWEGYFELRQDSINWKTLDEYMKEKHRRSIFPNVTNAINSIQEGVDEYRKTGKMYYDQADDQYMDFSKISQKKKGGKIRNYDPSEPRVEPGQSGGGQWTAGGAGDDFRSNFTTVKSISEAEARIKKVTKSKNVSLDGISISQANDIVYAFEDEGRNKFGMPLTSISTYNPYSDFYGRNANAAAFFEFDTENKTGAFFINKQGIDSMPYMERPTPLEDQLQTWEDQKSRIQTLRDNTSLDQTKVDELEKRIDDNIYNIQKQIAGHISPLVVNQSVQYKSSDDRMKSVVYHEIGHLRLREQYLGQKTSASYSDWKDLRLGNDYHGHDISDYGKINEDEYFAEWYSAYKMNSRIKLPDQVAAVINTIKSRKG